MLSPVEAHGERYRRRLEARLSIFEYVELFYKME